MKIIRNSYTCATIVRPLQKPGKAKNNHSNGLLKNVYLRVLYKGISLILILLLFYCKGAFKDKSVPFPGSSMPYIAASQIANGVWDVPRDSTGKAIIAENESYFRVKMHDDPLPVTNPDNGLVHFLIDYAGVAKVIYDSGDKTTTPMFESFSLTVSGIEVKPEGRDMQIIPPLQNRITMIENNKRYTAVINNLELPEGNYEFLRVKVFDVPGNQKKTQNYHMIRVGGAEYPLEFQKKKLEFNMPFRVEKGRITSLHTVPRNNKIIKAVGKEQNFKSEMELDSKGIAINVPIDKIWVNMKKITATKSTGETYVINDTPTRFELLGLRNSMVILLGNIILPAGQYSFFTFELDRDNSVELESQGQPVQIVNESNFQFTTRGQFELRGGRMTEVFFDFNPNLSVFYTLNNGFVLEPDIRPVAVVSMTAEQDLRVVSSLKEYTNAVVKESDLIFQGSVTVLNSAIQNTSAGTPSIFTNVDLHVEDRLRGNTQIPDNFSISTLGGTVGGLTLKVRSMPEFSQGERSILFLKLYGDRYIFLNGRLGKVSM